jgi:hypothetical protein
VLDEPANGLDPEGIVWLRGFLRHLAAQGRTVLVSSHVLGEVQHTVDDVVVIARGSLVHASSLSELAATAGARTYVETPTPERLAELCAERGWTCAPTGAGHEVPDVPAAEVGAAAYAEKVDQPGGFVLPHPPRDSRTFPTPQERAVFAVSPLDVLHVPEGRLLLQTMRSHDQFNTTIYGLDDRYRGVRNGRRVVFVHPEDITALGFTDGDLVLDVSRHEVRRAGESLALTAREFDLLRFLLAHPGTAWSREDLLERVWGWSVGDLSTVTVHVRRLREKVEADPKQPARLVTVWGVGYRWEPAPA